MKTGKLLSIILAACMILSTVALTSCSGDDGKYTVGVIQLATHDALDAATEGFIQALKDKLGEENVEIDVQNAAGSPDTCATIANSFVTKRVDLIMANATPALQAAYNATTEIPILGTSVTEYGVALGIKDFNGTVGGNVSGTSDLASLEKQAQKGITCTNYEFSDSNDVTAIAQKAASECDAIYIPTDNTAATCADIIYGAMGDNKKPIIAGEAGICSGCGIATLSISYYDLGYKTGEMAAQILTGEADIATMAIAYAPQETKKYNADICADLGIDIEALKAAGYVALD